MKHTYLIKGDIKYVRFKLTKKKKNHLGTDPKTRIKNGVTRRPNHPHDLLRVEKVAYPCRSCKARILGQSN